MNYRIITCLLAGICLTGVSGCSNTASVASSETPSETSVSTDTTQAEPEFVAITTKEYTERTLSDQIPEKAVFKDRTTHFQNGEIDSVFDRYFDEHNNILLSIQNPDDANEKSVFLNAEYEYNDHGDEIYHRMLSDNVNEEYYSEYDSSNRIISNTVLHKGIVEMQSTYEYDQYGNTLLDRFVRYDETGGIRGERTEDYSDCDYDSNGNMTAIRQPDKTSEYTYDSEGRVLTERILFHGDTEKIQEIVYTYDPVSGMETLKNVNNMSKDGSPISRFITESEYDSNLNLIRQVLTYYDDGITLTRSITDKTEYDSKGRIIKNTQTYSDIDDISITEHEYEELK